MSNTREWSDRLALHRYSQDERALSYKFIREISGRVDAFLDDATTKSLVVGSYDLEKEPWRLAAVGDFRKYNLKLREKATAEGTELSLHKSNRS
jgi:hypothetical protein